MPVWTNPDGLVQRFGTSFADTPTSSLEQGVLGRIEVKLKDASALEQNNAAKQDRTKYSDEVAFSLPPNSYILRGWFVVDEAFAGATAKLDIGLVEKDGTPVAIGGIKTGAATAALGANAVVVADGASVGGVVKTSATKETFVSFAYDTAAFSAGAGRLFIEYMKV